MNAPEKLPTAKYIHPHNGSTWSGRGQKPAWVKHWLDAGNSLEELVPAQASPPDSAPDLEAVALPSMVRLTDLHPSPTNPRRTFDAAALDEMAQSIRRHGVLQPILVRSWPEGQAVTPPATSVGAVLPAFPRYEIVAGERRYRAAIRAEVASIPATVRALSDDEVLEIQIIENLQREAVHPMEEAEGYLILMRRAGHSAEELADKVGKSRAYIYARLKLTALCDAARQAFRDGLLTASTALLVARIPGPGLQARYLDEIAHGYAGPLSYRDAARHAQNRYMLRLSDAPFDRGLDNLIDGAGPCATCTRRSGNQPELFADVESADVCTDPDCFASKKDAWNEMQRLEAAAAGRTLITGAAAEKIIPAWSHDPTHTSGGSGYVALDAKCEHAAPAENPDDPEPQPPAEPDDDSDDVANAAYLAADDAYESALRDWQDRQVAAQPSYRNLLAGAIVPSVFVPHPKTGTLVECVALSDAAPVLQARGVNAATGYNHREAEKVAKEQTAIRRRLLDAILFGAGDMPLADAEWRLIAAAAYQSLDFNDQQMAVRIWAKTDGKIERADTDDLRDNIKYLDAADLITFLRLTTLVRHVRVHAYSATPTTLPAPLASMADHWGIDVATVRRQVGEELAKPKKGAQ